MEFNEIGDRLSITLENSAEIRLMARAATELGSDRDAEHAPAARKLAKKLGRQARQHEAEGAISLVADESVVAQHALVLLSYAVTSRMAIQEVTELTSGPYADIDPQLLREMMLATTAHVQAGSSEFREFMDANTGAAE